MICCNIFRAVISSSRSARSGKDYIRNRGDSYSLVYVHSLLEVTCLLHTEITSQFGLSSHTTLRTSFLDKQHNFYTTRKWVGQNKSADCWSKCSIITQSRIYYFSNPLLSLISRKQMVTPICGTRIYFTKMADFVVSEVLGIIRLTIAIILLHTFLFVSTRGWTAKL